MMTDFFVTAKLSIRYLKSSSVLITTFNQHPSLRMETFTIINLRYFSTKLKWDCIHHANLSTTNFIYCFAFTFKLEPRQTMQSVAFPASIAPCQLSGHSRHPFSPKCTIVSRSFVPQK